MSNGSCVYCTGEIESDNPPRTGHGKVCSECWEVIEKVIEAERERSDNV